jgi:hypothetical protein
MDAYCSAYEQEQDLRELQKKLEEGKNESERKERKAQEVIASLEAELEAIKRGQQLQL